MAKKLPELADTQQISSGVLSLARRIWLAGLGAFARIEEEGGRFFESLVEEGKNFEAQLKKSAGDKIQGVKDRVGDTWDRLEQRVEESLSKVLKGFNVPTNDDIHGLSKRVETLRESIKSLSKL